ncbi:Phosphatidylinositol N-acetylglucosaminyltransferase [Mycena indigotica]|uniref:Phosphatidylinositol N-acetylglucosaminyltransferase n=1 Tax=Mycena indigotica TaxID=2126181 RepID=A0A8H6WC35_9AGAR|nr:Phosphatidylinositol N-acetylglucosaminyltransferase [Mycena indigotica]KAF7306939.1 Phosphatidylinositol N-acetylglucosaminyltransferase [Mycena indigotica]
MSSTLVRVVWLLLLICSFVSSSYAALHKWEATNFCKCICFAANYSILPLEIPDNPSQPCLSCTKQWCLNQNLPMCHGASLGDTNPDTATGKEGDVEARCFQRDSPRDQLVVTIFLLTVFGLLLGAGIKSRMVKAGFTEPQLPWEAGRRWWDAWTPGAPIALRSLRRGTTSEYAPVINPQANRIIQVDILSWGLRMTLDQTTHELQLCKQRKPDSMPARNEGHQTTALWPPKPQQMLLPDYSRSHDRRRGLCGIDASLRCLELAFDHHRMEYLWHRKPQPDNYFDPQSFLLFLRRNDNFRPYTYWPLVLLSCAITQHLATIFVFIAVFVRLRENQLDAHLLVWVSVSCFLVGYLLWELLERKVVATAHRRANRVKAVKSSILIFLALMSLSPVLRTLTAATSSDSIWALSAILFALNALLADYSATSLRGERLTSVLSMNAAISASVVLASRLSNDLAVFALILFSVQTFALFPRLRHRLASYHARLQVAFTVVLFIASIIVAFPFLRPVIGVYIVLQLSLTFLAPAVLVWAQKFKNEIRGPWDVAVPKVNRMTAPR